MKQLKLTSLALLLAAGNAYAQPAASDLVGKFYGGVHANYLDPSDERYITKFKKFDESMGLGWEVGYRATEEVEFRFSYTHFDLEIVDRVETRHGSAVTGDLLYFPYAESFYVLGGVSNLDIGPAEISIDAGLGYRHYFTDNLALYAEAKIYHQFVESTYNDQVAQIGLVYFFGDVGKPAAKPAPVKKPMKKAEAPKPVEKKKPMPPKDSDKDGVPNKKDKCKNTPMNDKVDAKGCTVFTEKTSTQRLSINFANNKADIASEYTNEVAKIAKLLKKYPHINVTIEGHSSAQGAAEYNKTLSQKRADAVVESLVNDYKIDESRLTAVGYGEERLLNTANTAAAHKENRRIEATIKVTEKVRVTK